MLFACGTSTDLASFTMAGRKLLDLNAASAPLLSPVPGGELASKKGGVNLGAVIMVCVGAFAISKIILGLLCYWHWAKTQKICEVKVSGGKMVLFKSSGRTIASTKVLLKKIKCLSSKDIIGCGGYGVVYQLVVDDNTEFAIKKLPKENFEQERGFERELQALSDIKHRNIVPLRGYFIASNVNLLIYELMRNGSLEMMLHGGSNDQFLGWPTRLHIALGAARGIAYLHYDCIPYIIHRDIKSSNILLDENLEPCVSDFGLANLLDTDKSHATTIVAGTLGYLAPEFVETGNATRKCDVFSYGVVLLELITGKRPTDAAFMAKGINLVIWVRSLHNSGLLEDVFDDSLRDSCSGKELKEATYVACQCVDLDPQKRPSMSQVVKMLERLVDDLEDKSDEMSASGTS